MRPRTMFVLALAGLSTSAPAWAAGPARGIPYSGRLEIDGLAVSGPVAMTFTLLNAANGGATLWTEAQTVTVSAGAFTAVLGSVTALPDTVYEAPELYLEIAVAGLTLQGRKRLYPMHKAERARTLQVPKDTSRTSRIGFDAQASDPGEIAHVESPDNSATLWLSSSEDWGAAASTADDIAFGDRAANVRRHWFRADGAAAISGALAVGKATAPATTLDVNGNATVTSLTVGGDTLRQFRVTAPQTASIALTSGVSEWSETQDVDLGPSGSAVCFLLSQTTTLWATTLDDGTSLTCHVLVEAGRWKVRAAGSRGHHQETGITITCSAACLTW